jgi:hypothetical protein
MRSQGVVLQSKWDENGENGEPLKLVAMRSILEARYEQDAKFRAVLTAVRARSARLLHFERSGSKSFWGGVRARRRDSRWVATSSASC